MTSGDETATAVDRVRRFLSTAGAEVRIEEFSEGTPTAADAARAIGCPASHIVKSMIVECGGEVVLAMVPGDRRVDLTKVADAGGGKDARIATANRVRELTGFEPGAVAPFPLPRVDRALLHPSLLGLGRVWVGAGSTRHMAGLAPGELLRLANAEPLDIAADD